MRNHRRGSPAGMLLVCVLVCLGIASTILLVSVQSSLRARRQMRTEIQLQQTRWLLEAGAIRGVQKLRADRDYTGETWRVDEALGRYADARVEIQVHREESAPETVRMDVVARIGPGAANPGSTRRSQTLHVAVEGPD